MKPGKKPDDGMTQSNGL